MTSLQPVCHVLSRMKYLHTRSATGELTSSISQGVAHFLHLSAIEGVMEVIVRCVSSLHS